MKIIKAAAPEIWEQKEGYTGMCEHIARCAAICYNSLPKVGKEAERFVKMLARKGHGRALEFGSLYIKDPIDAPVNIEYGLVQHGDSINKTEGIVMNLREWMEKLAYSEGRVDEGLNELKQNWDKYSSDANLQRRVTIHYPAISRAIADEFRTHTTLSTMVQSTRYVDQTQGNGIEIIKPTWWDEGSEIERGIARTYFMTTLQYIEEAYSRMIHYGYKRQEARDILPLSIKTEMVQCGFADMNWTGWQTFIRLRTANDAHPDARAMAEQVKLLIDEYNEKD